MGNALCDAWVDWVKTGTELEQTLGVAVNICVTNGGGIRASLPQVRRHSALGSGTKGRAVGLGGRSFGTPWEFGTRHLHIPAR
eukprot:362305-Chlamydomonas_euryale.AAC.3